LFTTPQLQFAYLLPALTRKEEEKKKKEEKGRKARRPMFKISDLMSDPYLHPPGRRKKN